MDLYKHVKNQYIKDIIKTLVSMIMTLFCATIILAISSVVYRKIKNPEVFGGWYSDVIMLLITTTLLCFAYKKRKELIEVYRNNKDILIYAFIAFFASLIIGILNIWR